MLLNKSQAFLSVGFISVCVPVSRSRHVKLHLKEAPNLVLVCGLVLLLLFFWGRWIFFFFFGDSCGISSKPEALTTAGRKSENYFSWLCLQALGVSRGSPLHCESPTLAGSRGC